MKSNDEEYLDSLLNSAKQSNNSNSGSALSRMSSKHSSGSGDLGGSGDIGMLVSNANGNEDLNDIGNLLDRLDNNELVDEKMASLLDDIDTPTDSSIPKFTVGDAPSINDVRDPEEIALDEAIADAERLDAEIQSGKFNQAPAAEPEQVPEQAPPEMAPLVDLEEGDDALLEMAPEVSLPEDNIAIPESVQDTDADQTPEEILTDLLDDMPEKDLMSQSEESVQDSLNDVLDNMQEEESAEAPAPEESALDDIAPVDAGIDESALDAAMTEEVPAEGIMTDDALVMETPAEEISGDDAPAAEEAASDELDIDNLSLDDLEAAMDEAIGEEGLSDVDMALEEIPDSALEDALSMPEDAPEEAPAEAAEEAPAEIPEEALTEASAETSDADLSLENLSEDDLNLDALEASLDNLLGTDEVDTSSTDGEIAALADAPESSDASAEGGEEEVSMQDLDALMNSLANDEIEDIESTAQEDEEAGQTEDSEIQKEEILDALTEEGFGDLGSDPSLDELASIPERGSSKSDDEDDSDEGKGKKGKKEKKEGFFARLIKALTKEDEEPSAEGLASLTDENQQVLNELGGEDGKGKGKAKKKKEKKPKEKKPKKEKPPKEKKPPKPKKEKKPKPPKDPGVPEKAISPKKVGLAFIFAISLGVLVSIPAFVLPDRIASQRANTAFTHKEYTTSYKMLYGKELSEDESIIYEQSRVLAWAQRYLDGYENYTAMNMKEEALDMLLMAMRNQEDLFEEAAKYSVENEVNTVYDSIESLLSESYGLSADEVAEINSIKKDRDYTIRLMEIVGTIES